MIQFFKLIGYSFSASKNIPDSGFRRVEPVSGKSVHMYNLEIKIFSFSNVLSKKEWILSNYFFLINPLEIPDWFVTIKRYGEIKDSNFNDSIVNEYNSKLSKLEIYPGSGFRVPSLSRKIASYKNLLAFIFNIC